MTRFKDFGIKPTLSTFLGDKIKIDKILNTEITVVKFKIEDSIKKAGSKFLTMQIEKADTKHIVFTGSNVLMNMIQQVPEHGFPFKSTIIKEGDHYEFT